MPFTDRKTIFKRNFN